MVLAINRPLPSEIATQYILLLLAEMKTFPMLGTLPGRGIIPPEVATMLPLAQQ